MGLLKIFFLLVLLCSNLVQAQLLPDNGVLSVQSVQRWMDSNRDFAPLVQMLDGIYSSELEMQGFERLPAAEQDQKINQFLLQNNKLDIARKVAAERGWKSVGEYMRLSSRLGNAIAAYFLLDSLQKVTEEQKKALREKADPAILAVSASDIAFVKANEKLLQQYIQAYSQGQ
ncbi:MAG TPA: hypothetical protein VN030_13525 [Cellvibrio sp.]|nr:hypothetical protein [Cellvibrio sp.]